MTDFNDLNGSSSALGEGSFKRRDELRRAEAVQRQKVKMGERLDRNIARAARKGDGASLNSFINARKAITGQAYGGQSGITSADDREQRVADGTIKGAKIRHDMGNIGATNNGMIAEAPPSDSVTPKNRPEWDNDGNGVPNSIQRPGIATPEAQGGLQAPPVAPSAQTGSGGLAAKRAAVGKLRDKWTGQNKANDPDSLEAAYEAKMGDPDAQAQMDREESFNAPAKDPAPQKESNEDRSLNDNLGIALQNANDIATAASERTGKVLAGSKASMDKYEIADKERIAKRDAGLAASQAKLKNELIGAEQSGLAQRQMTAAYFNDVAGVEERNKEYTDSLTSLNPIRMAGAAMFGDMEAYPIQPAPINRDTFDPKNPPKYQRQLPSSVVTPEMDKSRKATIAKYKTEAAKKASDDLARALAGYQAPPRLPMRF